MIEGYERTAYNNPFKTPATEDFGRPYIVTRRPDGSFYYIFKISDLFCKEMESEPPNFSIELNLTVSRESNTSELFDSGKPNMSEESNMSELFDSGNPNMSGSL